MPEDGEVQLAVFDVTGREVAVLASGRFSSGDHAETWTPSGTSPGVYFLRLTTPSGTAVRKVTLVE